MVEKYLLATGGTGGHIMPALALAEELGNKCVILTDRRINLVNYRLSLKQKEGDSNEEINIQYLPVHSSKNIIKFFFSLIPSVFKALKIIRENKSCIIISFGGYPTVPVLIAAILTRTPFILHEANTIIGRTNRFFLKFASKMTAGLPLRNHYNKNNNINNKSNNKKLNEKKYILTGNPVTSEIKPCPYPVPETSEDGLKTITILVFGGSQGAEIFTKEIPKILIEFNSELKLIANGEVFNAAKALNKKEESDVEQYKDKDIAVKQAVEPSKKLEAIKGLKNIKGINIIQQCKKESIVALQSFYKKHSIKCEINHFFSDLPGKIRKAHLIICRAGALSISEILIIGRPSILIPYPFAKDNHQLFNAQYVCKGGSLRSTEPENKKEEKEEMAVLLEQKDLTAENLIFSINKILNNIDYYLENIRKFPYKNPTEELIKIIKETF